MSDPLANDYASVTTLSESERRRALHGALKVAKRRNASPDEALAFLEMLGLTDTAAEIAGRPLKSTSRVPLAVRDNIGRLRTSEAPKKPTSDEPDPIPPGQHGHNGRCASGDHAWIEENIRPASEAKPARCRRCEQRRRRCGASGRGGS